MPVGQPARQQVVNPATLLYPLQQASFDAGFLLAAATTALAVREHRGRRAQPAVGLIMAAATLVTLLATGNAPAPIVPALAHLVRPACLAAPLLPGAALLAWFPAPAYPPPVPHVLWVRLAVMAMVVGGSLALWSFDRRWGQLSPGLLTVSTAGIFATVPDTQQAVALMGVAGGVALMAWHPRLRLGQVGIPPLLGVVAWTVAVGGRGRHSAIVGGLTCLGLLVIEPLVHLLLSAKGHEPTTTGRRGLPRVLVLAALGGQLLVASLESRVAGLTPTTQEAVVIGLPVLVAAFGMLLAWQRVGWRWAKEVMSARPAGSSPGG